MADKQQPVQLKFSVDLQKLPAQPSPDAVAQAATQASVAETPGSSPAEGGYMWLGGVLILAAALAGGYGWWHRRRQMAMMPPDLPEWATPDSEVSMISLPFNPSGVSPLPGSSGPMPLPADLQSPDPRPVSRGGFAGSSASLPSGASEPRPGDYPEAVMAELHELRRRLKYYRTQDDSVNAIRVLTRHINTRKRTSPWVFLELLRLLQRTGDTTAWQSMKPVFQIQFGQTAPDEGTPLRVDALEDDIGLCLELTRLWPSTSTRMWIDRWMLGTGTPIGSGPPQLTIQTYRDLLWIDEFLHYMTREAIEKRLQKLQAVN